MDVPTKILIIEDDLVDAEFVHRGLKSISENEPSIQFELQHEQRFSTGLTYISEEPVDLVILDLGLPDITGDRSLQHLCTYHPEIPVIVLTGMTNRAVALKSLREGAQDFLIKGESSPRELQRCITYAIERHRLKLELKATASMLADKTSILQSVINHMGDGVIVTDNTGKLTLFNPAAVGFLDVNWLDHPSEEWPSMLGSFRPGLLDRITVDEMPFAEALKGQAVDEEEFVVRTETYPEGRHLSITARSILNENEVVNGCVAVLHDITKRRKIEQLKDDFVSVVSHELRTPLTSINGSLGLVLGGIAGLVSDEAKEMIEVAQRNSDRLVRLINDLLDMQKLESGKLELNLKPINVQALVKQALTVNAGYAVKHNVSFELTNFVGDTVWVYGDEDRMIQVLTNLLSNAAKYSPEFGQVTLEASMQDGKIKISVRDQGPGIPQEFHQEIFGKFSQADASTTRQKEGTGLGLNICKSIVTLHGGEIDFISTPGHGATFFFLLPEYQQGE